MVTEKGKVVWIARGSLSTDPESPYEIHMQKPLICKEISGHSCIASIGPENFVRITGYKLKPGECRRVRIKIEEVK